MTDPDSPVAPNDRELLEACRKGDPEAWERLVRKYRHLVYSIALKSRLDPETAADVFQSVFLNLIRSLHRLRRQDTLVPWLVTATKRESWKAARASARASNRATDDATARDPRAGSVSTTPQEELEAFERQVLVRAALDRLDGRCRRLLGVLFYSDPAPSYEEISRAQRMPVSSIGPTRIRCLEKLHRELGREPRFSHPVSKRTVRRSIPSMKDEAP